MELQIFTTNPKRIILFIFSLLCMNSLSAQEYPFGDGERLKFRVKYGIITAGYSELTTKITAQHLEFNARGWSTSFFDNFFKVRDYYYSKTTPSIEPVFFKRDVTEGKYSKQQETHFYTNASITGKDTLETPPDVQDLLSFFYHLRNRDFSQLDILDEITIPIFLNDEIFYTTFIYRNDEFISSTMGYKKCMHFSVKVASGRVFGEGEPLDVWVTKDSKNIPLKLKTDLAVGSIQMVLEEYEPGNEVIFQ